SPGLSRIGSMMMAVTFSKRLSGLLLLAAGISLCASPAWATQTFALVSQSPTHDVTVIHCPHMIDTVAGKVRGATSVIVKNDRISKMKPGTVTPDDAEVIDLADDNTCIPGLIDGHTHLTSQGSKNGYSEKFRLNPADYAIRSTVFARRTLLAG